MINKYRPINLNLTNIKFPVTAIASISHRISGVIVFIMIGISLVILKLSLLSKEHFCQIKLIVNNIFVKFIIWFVLIFSIYHLISGIRNILMDIGYLNTTLEKARKSANITFLLTGILSVMIGFLLC